MGMAASQARYLALVARKSNCEFEGQQINQARTALSNQSANLFNQMLGLSVPVPPSTSDYTKTVYTYSDGLGKETKLENWQQLSHDDPEFNYVVTRSYSTNRYTGSIKKMNDPQVQFTEGMSSLADIEAVEARIRQCTEDYEAAQKATTEAKKELDDIQKQVNELKNKQANISNYSQPLENITKCEYATDDKTPHEKDEYSITTAAGTDTYKAYSQYTEEEQTTIKTALTDLMNAGAISEAELSNYYFYKNDDNWDFAKSTDLNKLATEYAKAEDKDNFKGSLTNFDTANIATVLEGYQNDLNRLTGFLTAAQNGYDAAKAVEETAKQNYDAALEEYDKLKHPTYLGNLDLVPLAELSDKQLAELQQVVNDMKEQEIESNLLDCFEYDETTGKISAYKGGVYSFQMNGVTYYTSYEDLEESYNSGTGPNHIDGQTKLAYYNAVYLDTTISETQKALVETDGNGRFTSIKFEDDSIVYTLNMGTETDDVAYKDAMNQYYYDNAVYDKMIRDINAKTSIIQQEDQQLELRLKQLDTEQSALSTEMEAVKKVVDDNVESSFKTFGG